MDKELLHKSEQLSSKRKKKKIWKSIVSALACIVVFCTTYALILPAITMETNTFCGQAEHSHSDDCYETELVCKLSDKTVEIKHEHDDSCYVEEKALVCGQKESAGHSHTDDCKKIDTYCVCGQEESEEHSHTDDCYKQDVSYICGQEESTGHSHTDDCYSTEKKLVCEKTTETSAEKHVHGESCYDKKLVCDVKEHKHEKQCYSNPNADVETAEEWEKTLPDELTGVWADDVLAVADSQLGYEESTKNYIVDEKGKTKGYSRYGHWYGDKYGHWCAMFVSFCLNYADVDEELIPHDASCQNWIETLSEKPYELYHEVGEYEPVPGDLIFFNWDNLPDSDHVGLVYEIIEATDEHGVQIKTIEGNASNTVKYRTYDIDDDSIMGYAQLPENPNPEEEEVVEEPEVTEKPSRKMALFAARSDPYAPGVELTGDLNTDLLAIAESQIGKDNYSGNYGAWHSDIIGGETSDWTAQFVNYCLYYAGITSGIPNYTSGDMSTWINALKQSELYFEKGNGVPEVGDLVIGYPSYHGDPVTVGIVKEVQENGRGINAIVAFSNGVGETGLIWDRTEGFIHLPKGELTAEVPGILTAKATYQIGAVPDGAKLVVEFLNEGEDSTKDTLVKQAARNEDAGVRAIYYVKAYFTLNGEKIDVPAAAITIDFNPDLDPNEVHGTDEKPQQPQAWKYYKISEEGVLSGWNPKHVSVEPDWWHTIQDISIHYQNETTFVMCSTQNVSAEKVIVTDFGSVMLKGNSSSVFMSADVVANLVTDETLTDVWDTQLEEKYETDDNPGYKIKKNHYLELYFTEGGKRVEPKAGEDIEIKIEFTPALDSNATTYAKAGAPTWYINNLSNDSVDELQNEADLSVNSNSKITGVTLQYEKADVFSFTSMQDTYTLLENELTDGNTKVTVAAIGKENVLPEGSQMIVEFVENEDVETALKAEHESNEYKLSNIQLFTIKFLDAKGDEFTPEPNQVRIKITPDPAFSAAFEGDVLTIGEWVMNYASEENDSVVITDPVEENEVELNMTDDFELTDASFLYSENDYFALSAKMADPNYKREVTVYNYSELEEAVKNAGNEMLIITLGGDFEAEGTIEIPSGKRIVVDLAGRTLTTSDSTLFNVTGGRLTIQDKEATSENVNTVTGKEIYGNDASYDGKTLTYYVTVPTVINSTTGETSEHLEKHTVNIKGEITGGSVPAIIVESGTVNLESGAVTNYSNRAIVQKSGTLNLKGGYICGNTAETIEVIDGVSCMDGEISGGAVYVTGDSRLNISGSVLAANSTSERGGAIAVESLNSPVVKMTGGVLSGNASTSTATDSGHGWHFGGGGIALLGNASMTMSGGYITNNKVYSAGYFDGGGGIFLADSTSFILLDGKVTGNYAAGGGGGIRADFMGEAYTNTIISGGFVSSNYAHTAEGGGVSIGWDGVAHVTGGFITNNRTATVQHWGGGGLFVANGGKLYIKNALVTENTAGGFGGGVAGCSTGHVFLISDRGSAIWGNEAEGTTVTDGSEKAEDKIYGKNNPVFMENGFADYFCALTSTVEGNMIGGGASNWKGSADEVPVTIGKNQSCTASYVMGLTASPNDTDKATALSIIKSSNGVYINGNDSHTHGGGVLCNGYLVFGQPGEIDFSTGLEVHGTKQLLDGTETEIPLVDADGNPVTFKFYIVDANTNTVVSTGKNNEDGAISFSARIPFAKAGTFTYYVYEDQDYNSDGFVMDTSKYRITVDVEAEKSYLNNAGEDTIIKTQYVIKHITVEKNSGNGKWTTVKSENVSWANEYEYAPVVLPLTNSTTFKNYSLESTKVAVEKKWAGEIPKDVPQITVGLYRISKVKGEEPSEPGLYGEKITLSEENNWSYVWNEELPLLSDDGNTTYEYQVIEDDLTGYAPSYEVHNNTKYDEQTGKYINVTTYVITNTKTEELKYTVDVTKISDEKSPNGQDIPLGNAEFEFTVKNSALKEGTVLYFLKESDGSYVLCDEDTVGATTTLITNFRGKLVLKELPAGTYVLEETKAPTGYVIAEKKEFILGEELDTTTITYKMVDERETSNFILPETGGSGTNTFTITGILLLMISILLYIKMKNQMKGGQSSTGN